MTLRVASAHVAPSPTENNRYLKVVLLPGELRVVHTVFFGDRPGVTARQRMDTSGDGLLDDGERDAFGQGLRDQVAAEVRIELDGRRVDGAGWRVMDVGLGIPETRGGAFAVDLELRTPAPAGAHRLVVEDLLVLPVPGEQELRIEESPGVRAVAAHVDGRPAPLQLRYSWKGPARPGERAVAVEFTGIEGPPGAGAPPSAPTRGPTSPARPAESRALLWIALGLATAGGVSVLVYSRRRNV